jgi:NitT/TauT family transport system substrate-binding protein
MSVLANGCDGGWMMLAKPGITSLQQLKGKKVAVQNGSIALVSLDWKLKQEKVEVEYVYMDNHQMPIPLQRGDVDAIVTFEPYCALTELSGWGKRLWVPYDTPMGKTNLGFVASTGFVKKEPDLTRKLVKAHVRATKEILDHPEISLETTMKQFNMSKEVAELSAKNLFFTTESGEAFQGGLRAMATMLIDAKLLEKEPSWGEFINTSFL